MDRKQQFRNIITDFAKDNSDVEQLQFILRDEIELEELDDQGLVNHVFRVSPKSKGQSVIIKYGEEKMRVQVDGIWLLSLQRQQVEYDALILMADILPESAPHPYCFDVKHHIIAMEDLQGMEILSTQLAAGRVDATVAARIGKLTAEMHNRTSRRNVSDETWEMLKCKFSHQSMKANSKQFTFVDVFDEKSSLIVIPEGGLHDYRQAVEHYKVKGLKDKLFALFDANECLIHADAHWNHFAISENSDRIAIFDFEITFLGHPCYHMTYTLLGYVFFYHAMSEKPQPEQESFCRAAKLSISELVGTYLSTTNLYVGAECQAEFVENVALFTGCKQLGLAMFRKLDGLIPIKDKQQLTLVKSARNLIENYTKIHTPTQLAEALLWYPSVKK